MPRWPRSTSRVRPPVWRARWKRRLSACRWRNTSSAILRTARCVTLANRNSRSSVNTVVDSAQQRRRRRAAPAARRAARPSPVERVDDALHHQRHADVGELRRDQAGERGDDPALVLPEVGQQLADRRPVAAPRARHAAVDEAGAAEDVLWPRMGECRRRSVVPRARRPRRRRFYRAPGYVPRRVDSTSAASPCRGRRACAGGRATTRCRRSRGSPSRRARCRTRPTTAPCASGERAAQCCGPTRRAPVCDHLQQLDAQVLRRTPGRARTGWPRAT